jgi:hypothetical protein
LLVVMICGMLGMEMVEMLVIAFDLIYDHFVFFRSSAFTNVCK